MPQMTQTTAHSTAPRMAPSTADQPRLRLERPRTRLEKVRYIRMASRRRVRGGEDVAPLAVQHVARRVDDVAHVGADRARRALAGDRPFMIGLVVIMLLAVTVVSGPLQAWLSGQERLDIATSRLGALDAATAELDQRAADLGDLEHVEVLAREQLGYAMPGQVAYTLVPPEAPAADGGPDGTLDEAVPPPAGTDSDTPWWQRVLSLLSD